MGIVDPAIAAHLREHELSHQRHSHRVLDALTVGAGRSINSSLGITVSDAALDELTDVEAAGAAWAVLVLFIVVLIAQSFIVFWKKRHYRSYQNVTLVLLWILPFGFAVSLHYLRFLLCWTLYSLATANIVYKATRKPLEKATPRLVYTSFSVLNTACNLGSIIGFLLLLTVFFGLPEGINYMGFMLLFYSLYFGILTRDFAEMCAGTCLVCSGLLSLLAWAVFVGRNCADLGFVGGYIMVRSHDRKYGLCVLLGSSKPPPPCQYMRSVRLHAACVCSGQLSRHAPPRSSAPPFATARPPFPSFLLSVELLPLSDRAVVAKADEDGSKNERVYKLDCSHQFHGELCCI